MEKYCKKCDETRPIEAFHKNKAESDGLTRYCKPCISAANKEAYVKTNYYEKNKDRIKAYGKQYAKDYPDKVKEQRKRALPRRYEAKFGITMDHFNEMLKSQNNGCAICGGVNKNGKALSVDHNHDCCPGTKSCGSCVRQLLCNSCNVAIGMFEESPDLLRKAANYLEAHNEVEISEE